MNNRHPPNCSHSTVMLNYGFIFIAVTPSDGIPSHPSSDEAKRVFTSLDDFYGTLSHSLYLLEVYWNKLHHFVNI